MLIYIIICLFINFDSWLLKLFIKILINKLFKSSNNLELKLKKIIISKIIYMKIIFVLKFIIFLINMNLENLNVIILCLI